MATETKLMTAEELLRLPDDGRFYELVDGRLVAMSPPSGMHGVVMATVSLSLGHYVKEGNFGIVLAGDPGIILRRGPDTVRGPDVCFFGHEQLPGGIPPSGYLDVVPDFVIEIVSPGDTAAEAQEKIEDWLAAGARLVWAMYPKTRSIVAYQREGIAQVYREQERIDAAPVLPGFSLRAGELFV